MKSLEQLATDIIARYRYLGLLSPEAKAHTLAVDELHYRNYKLKQERKGLPVAPYLPPYRAVWELEPIVDALGLTPSPECFTKAERVWANDVSTVGAEEPAS